MMRFLRAISPPSLPVRLDKLLSVIGLAMRRKAGSFLKSHEVLRGERLMDSRAEVLATDVSGMRYQVYQTRPI